MKTTKFFIQTNVTSFGIEISSLYKGNEKIAELNEDQTNMLIPEELREESQELAVEIDSRFAKMLINGKKTGNFNLRRNKIVIGRIVWV